MSPADLTAAVQLACLLEVVAPKPGNVSVGAPFHDTRAEDFLASAAAIGPAFSRAGGQPLGRTICAAIEATRRWTAVNTNLGIVLLLAPLARAAGNGTPGPLRARLAATLARTTVEDTREVYAAIRLAAPGGLGRVADQDVQGTPTIPLRDAMALAADRDAIAREYATEFRATFEVGAPAFERALGDDLSWSDATVDTYLTLLAAAPDTHIARKLGPQEAAAVQSGAREVLAAGGVRRPAGRDAITELDRELRDPRNARNPGATADLTAAAIFVALVGGAWSGRREEIRGSAR
jgi:triphosphoribosyl-dephospho-CoA synthase